jgi:GT2 family glycosyltransferase
MNVYDVSLVIPVCHGGRFLRAALDSTLTLDYPADRMELLVTFRTEDRDARLAVTQTAAGAPFAVRSIVSSQSNRAARLNRACAAARGRLLAFTDDDCVLPPDWLRAIESVMASDPNIGAVGGRDEVLTEHAFDLALDWVLNAPVGAGRYRLGPDRGKDRYYPKLWNMAVVREVAESVALPAQDSIPGVFDDSLPAHEDVELMRRIEASGRKLVYAPEVRVSHHRDTTLLSFMWRNFRMARVCRREGLHRLPHRVLSAACIGASLLAVAALAVPSLGIFITAVFGLYAAVLLVSAVVGAVAKRSLAAVLHIPLMLAGLHIARGLGYLFPARPRGNRRAKT